MTNNKRPPPVLYWTNIELKVISGLVTSGFSPSLLEVLHGKALCQRNLEQNMDSSTA
jgi:hypothetical protein